MGRGWERQRVYGKSPYLPLKFAVKLHCSNKIKSLKYKRVDPYCNQNYKKILCACVMGKDNIALSEKNDQKFNAFY